MRKIRYRALLPVYLAIMGSFFLIAVGGSRAVTVLSENVYVGPNKIVVIDAGHGGVDGGATSCTGKMESQYNLEIALRLNDLMHLLGIHTKMIRETDCSVYTNGDTISQKKISDLRERVRIVNSLEGCVLVSIHQNYFSDSKYSGAQVFYAPTDGSKELADKLQQNFIYAVNPGSNRQTKKAEGIYLMQQIHTTGVLVECGFLSNSQEEYLLRSEAYQQKLCTVIACTLSNLIFDT